jgi:energy-coupling factor transporter ATP-binding protein EcfA2
MNPIDSPEKLVDVRNLSVDFHSAGTVTHAVRNISFDIKKGETVALVGESGSDKSVTALSITRLLPYPAASHPSGAILFKGRDVLQMSEPDMRQIRGRDIGRTRAAHPWRDLRAQDRYEIRGLSVCKRPPHPGERGERGLPECLAGRQTGRQHHSSQQQVSVPVYSAGGAPSEPRPSHAGMEAFSPAAADSG